MAEINNTQWLEEYLKMWTSKERMGRIHKVTTFDPTYHCYPEGVYLLDDDCRAHTAIYVVDKNHNVHIIYDGMAWDLLSRAVEKGLSEISLKLSEGDKGLVAVLERILTAQNTCCAGLQAKLKKIGDELERIADAIDGGGGTPKPKPEPDPEPKPEKKTLLLAKPDRHKVTKDKKVYTSVITSIVKDIPEQPWTITDDFATYPDWATVSTDKAHVYITTDGSKPGKGKNDPWNIEPDPNPNPNPNPNPKPKPDPNPGGDDHTGGDDYELYPAGFRLADGQAKSLEMVFVPDAVPPHISRISLYSICVLYTTGPDGKPNYKGNWGLPHTLTPSASLAPYIRSIKDGANDRAATGSPDRTCSVEWDPESIPYETPIEGTLTIEAHPDKSDPQSYAPIVIPVSMRRAKPITTNNN